MDRLGIKPKYYRCICAYLVKSRWSLFDAKYADVLYRGWLLQSEGSVRIVNWITLHIPRFNRFHRNQEPTGSDEDLTRLGTVAAEGKRSASVDAASVGEHPAGSMNFDSVAALERDVYS